jgi:transcriptional regulator with XRE-family HTH domain
MPRQFSGRALRQARINAGLSRMTLAAEVGRHVNSVANMERGSAVPRADTLARLADALGVTVDDLYAARRVAKRRAS